jgi:hypothetical protein
MYDNIFNSLRWHYPCTCVCQIRLKWPVTQTGLYNVFKLSVLRRALDNPRNPFRTDDLQGSGKLLLCSIHTKFMHNAHTTRIAVKSECMLLAQIQNILFTAVNPLPHGLNELSVMRTTFKRNTIGPLNSLNFLPCCTVVTTLLNNQTC